MLVKIMSKSCPWNCAFSGLLRSTQTISLPGVTEPSSSCPVGSSTICSRLPDKLLSGEMKVMLLESDRVKLGGDGGDAQDGEGKGAGEEEGGDGIAEGRRRGERSWRWEVELEIMLREEERREGRL